MTKKTTLQRISPDELPDLLTRLDDGQTTELVLIGPDAEISASPDDWPMQLQGHVVFELTGDLSGLPRELLRLDRLKALTLWSLGLQDADAAAIAEHLGQLTSLDLRGNKVGEAGTRAFTPMRSATSEMSNPSSSCSCASFNTSAVSTAGPRGFGFA